MVKYLFFCVKPYNFVSDRNQNENIVSQYYSFVASFDDYLLKSQNKHLGYLQLMGEELLYFHLLVSWRKHNKSKELSLICIVHILSCTQSLGHFVLFN